jgi:hypothetical protein
MRQKRLDQAIDAGRPSRRPWKRVVRMRLPWFWTGNVIPSLVTRVSNDLPIAATIYRFGRALKVHSG